MKVLVVTVEAAKFSKAAKWRLAFQGKVLTDVCQEVSDTPTFNERDIKVPFAVVRDGAEVLVVTAQNCTEDVEHPVREGQGASKLVAPGKEAKTVSIEIKEGIENSVISGTIEVTYRLVKTSMKDNIQKEGGMGLNVQAGYFNIKSAAIEVFLIKAESNGILATGKITNNKPYAFLDLNRQASQEALILRVRQKDQSEYEIPVQVDGPRVTRFSYGSVEETDAPQNSVVIDEKVLFVSTQLSQRQNNFLTIINHADIEGTANSNSGRYIIFLQDAGSNNPTSTEDIEKGLSFWRDGFTKEDSVSGPKSGVYVIPRDDEKKTYELGVLGLDGKPRSITVNATVVGISLASEADPDNPEEEASPRANKMKYSVITVARGTLAETGRLKKDGANCVALSGRMQSTDGAATDLTVKVDLTIVDDELNVSKVPLLKEILADPANTAKIRSLSMFQKMKTPRSSRKKGGRSESPRNSNSDSGSPLPTDRTDPDRSLSPRMDPIHEQQQQQEQKIEEQPISVPPVETVSALSMDPQPVPELEPVLPAAFQESVDVSEGVRLSTDALSAQPPMSTGRSEALASAREARLKGVMRKTAAGVGLGMGGVIAEVMGSELKEKQKLLGDVMEENKQLGRALQTCGGDVVTLREELARLKRVIDVQKRAADANAEEEREARQYVQDLNGVNVETDMRALTRTDLIRMATAAGRRLQEADAEVVRLREYRADAKETRQRLHELTGLYAQLEQRHTSQGRQLEKTRDEQGKIDAFKSTIRMQERVIAKMQRLIEQRIRDETSASGTARKTGGPLLKWMTDEQMAKFAETTGELAKMKRENETMRVQLERLKSQGVANAHVAKMAEEGARARGENESLKIELDALREQVQRDARTSSQEVTRLRTRLFELEIGAALQAGLDENVELDPRLGFAFAHGDSGPVQVPASARGAPAAAAATAGGGGGGGAAAVSQRPSRVPALNLGGALGNDGPSGAGSRAAQALKLAAAGSDEV